MGREVVLILIDIQDVKDPRTGCICLFVGHQLIRTWRRRHTNPRGAPLELAQHIQAALESLGIDTEIELTPDPDGSDNQGE